MNPTDAATKASEALCAKLNIEGDGVDAPMYDPLADHAVGQNYTNYAPAIDGISHAGDIQHWFTDTIQDHSAADAVMVFAEECAAAWWSDKPDAAPMPEWGEAQIRHLCRDISSRYLQGHIGEQWVARNLTESPLAPERDDDETRGIDLRTTDDVTFQVKTVTNFGTADFEKENADRLIEVKTNDDGEVVGHQEK